MDTGQELSPVLPQDLESIFREPEGAESVLAEAKPELTAVVQKRPRRFLLPLVFGAGLLLGWLVIGWWLWPIQWTNSNPWQLQAKFQRTYVTLVAEEYWRTSNVFEAQESLAGWDRAELKSLLNAMRLDTTDAEARRCLSALAEALDMPGTSSSWFAALGQWPIILGALLVMAPLVVAVVLVVGPFIRKKTSAPMASPLQEAQAEAALEELLAGVQLEGEQVQADQAQQDQPLAQDQLPDEEQEERPTEEEEGGEKLSASSLGDLASLFEEEDTSLSASEAMAHGLEDIAVADLEKKVSGVVRQLKESNALRTWKSTGRVQ